MRAKPKPRVANPGRARVGNDRYICAGLEAFNKFPGALAFVVFVIADGSRVDTVVIE